MDGNVKIFVDKRSISYQRSCLESAIVGLLKQLFPDNPQWWGFNEVMLMLEILRDTEGYAIVNSIFSVFALEKTDVFATGCWNDFCSADTLVRMETIDSLYAKLRKLTFFPPFLVLLFFVITSIFYYRIFSIFIN